MTRSWDPLPVIDGHIDTANKALKDGRNLFQILSKQLDSSYPAMKAGAIRAALFAVFHDPEEPDGLTRAMSEWQRFFFENSSVLQQITKTSQLDELRANDNRIGVVMHLEGCAGVDPDLRVIESAYQAGLRSLGLTHFDQNRFGCGAVRNGIERKCGLTKLGEELVDKCEELGISVDVSHANDYTIQDIIRISSKPVFASHANARLVSPHGRNLSTSMIRAIANTGGTVGIMFSNALLSAQVDPLASNVDFECIKQHLDIILKYGGEDALAIGSDYDGATIAPCVDQPRKIQELFFYLHKEGYSISRLEKMAYLNLKRVFSDTWND